MSIRTEMAARCKNSATSPARGEVVIVPAHYAEARGATAEEKRAYLLAQASHGCCDGSGAFYAHARYETRVEHGMSVELIVAVAAGDLD